jgi:hypothetical protein
MDQKHLMCEVDRLDLLIEHNRLDEQTMLAVDLTGILRPELRKRFLEPLWELRNAKADRPEQRSGSDKPPTPGATTTH